MARVIAIWVFGLFASALIGGMIAHYFYGSDVDVFGALAGMAAFACGRIWSTERGKDHYYSKRSNQ
jgi:hypothetical protein